ncbi:MAG: hypothetical protein JO356_10300 [Acidobacteria bacterium]|nr:hypothetical protein [Acidobacteriota bacterium]
MKPRFTSALLACAVVAGSVGYALADDHYDHYYDRDDYRYQHDDYGYGYDHDGYGENFRRGMHVANEIGFRDGAQVAREDLWKRKPFNPRPRGRYDDADHGYRAEFGSIHEYREHYADAYREGYIRTFREYGYR